MKKLLLFLLLILFVSNAEARHFTIEIHGSMFATGWQEGNGYTWSTSGVDEEDELEYIKPTLGYAGGVSVWHDLTWWSTIGLRYTSGRQGYWFSPIALVGERVKPGTTTSWQLVTRLYPRIQEWTSDNKLYFLVGIDRTQTSWRYTHTLLRHNYEPTEEQIKEASSVFHQWSGVFGFGLIGGERVGFHSSLEWQTGVQLSSSKHAFILNQLVLSVGF
ncbi:hypothetical protein KQI63_12405 [bacterium]|nr:hypothetical protein [bacterium]